MNTTSKSIVKEEVHKEEAEGAQKIVSEGIAAHQGSPALQQPGLPGFRPAPAAPLPPAAHGAVDRTMPPTSALGGFEPPRQPPPTAMPLGVPRPPGLGPPLPPHMRPPTNPVLHIPPEMIAIARQLQQQRMMQQQQQQQQQGGTQSTPAAPPPPPAGAAHGPDAGPLPPGVPPPQPHFRPPYPAPLNIQVKRKADALGTPVPGCGDAETVMGMPMLPMPGTVTGAALPPAQQPAPQGPEVEEEVSTSRGEFSAPTSAQFLYEAAGFVDDGEVDDGGSGESGEPGSDSQGGKKARLVWTQELHNRFINALSHLGLKQAVPKNILSIMNVDGMTRENVASHLQKYRLYLKKLGGYHEKDKVDADTLQSIHEQNVQQLAAQQAMQHSLAAMSGSYTLAGTQPYAPPYHAGYSAGGPPPYLPGSTVEGIPVSDLAACSEPLPTSLGLAGPVVVPAGEPVSPTVTAAVATGGHFNPQGWQYPPLPVADAAGPSMAPPAPGFAPHAGPAEHHPWAQHEAHASFGVPHAEGEHAHALPAEGAALPQGHLDAGDEGGTASPWVLQGHVVDPGEPGPVPGGDEDPGDDPPLLPTAPGAEHLLAERVAPGVIVHGGGEGTTVDAPMYGY